MVGLGGTGHEQPRRVDHLAAARAEYAQVRGVGLQHMACTVCDTYCHTIYHTLSHIYDSVAHATQIQIGYETIIVRDMRSDTAI